MFAYQAVGPVGCVVLLLQCLAVGNPAVASEHVEAILRVSRKAVQGSDRDFEVYRRTQGALLSSQFVLGHALTSSELPPGLNVEVLARNLDVVVPNNTELILVRLPIGNRERAETATILNAIVKSYQTEVVKKERLEKIEALSRQRKRYQVVYDRIAKVTEEIESLSNKLGVPDAELSAGQSSVEVEVGKQLLLYLHQCLVELHLERLEDQSKFVEAGGEPMTSKDESGGSAERLVEAKIELLSELIEKHTARLTHYGRTHGELVARTEVLHVLRTRLSRVGDVTTDLEMEIDGPERVSVIQLAN